MSLLPSLSLSESVPAGDLGASCLASLVANTAFQGTCLACLILSDFLSKSTSTSVDHPCFVAFLASGFFPGAAFPAILAPDLPGTCPACLANGFFVSSLSEVLSLLLSTSVASCPACFVNTGFLEAHFPTCMAIDLLRTSVLLSISLSESESPRDSCLASLKVVLASFSMLSFLPMQKDLKKKKQFPGLSDSILHWKWVLANFKPMGSSDPETLASSSLMVIGKSNSQ